MDCICYCHGDYDQSADMCEHCILPSYGQIVQALRNLLSCVEDYSDADLSALGMKRSSRAVVEARQVLSGLPH